MPALVRMNRKELVDLIDSVEETGGDASEFRTLLDQVDEGKQQKVNASRRPVSPTGDEEPTAQERLEFEVGYLFPTGVSDDVMKKLTEYDWDYSLKQLRDMCVEAGLSPSGHKKLLAAKLLAHQRRLKDGEGGFGTGEPVGGGAG